MAAGKSLAILSTTLANRLQAVQVAQGEMVCDSCPLRFSSLIRLNSGEEKPACVNCQRQGEACDYSIRLNWDGRSKKKEDGKPGSQIISFAPSPGTPLLEPATTPNGFPEGSDLARVPSAGSVASQSIPPPIDPAPVWQQDSGLPPVSNFGNELQPPQDYQQNLLPAPPLLRNPTWGDRSSNGFFSAGNIPQLRHSMSLGSSYPSPESGFGSPGMPAALYGANGYSTQMPPPMPTSNPLTYQESVSSPYNGAKRVRLSPQTDAFAHNPTFLQRAGSYGPESTHDVPRVQFNSPHTPNFFPSYLTNPLTPATSQDNNEDRRISVSSLLSEDPEPSTSKRPSDSSEAPPPTSHAHFEPAHDQVEQAPLRRGSLHQRMISYSQTETYGHDRGAPDFDVPRNNDAMAISGLSPSEHSDFGSWLETEYEDPGFGFGIGSREQVFAKGGYYSSPVPIKIPRKLEPLPTTLSENPMNLLYFHHFLNHTARILVPHDCPENPFKTILPKSELNPHSVLYNTDPLQWPSRTPISSTSC